MAMALDTLSISRELRAAGFSEEQADALATQLAARPDNLVTKQDLALAVAELETKIDQLESKIDRIEPRLLVKLGAAIAAALTLMLSAVGIAVAVLLNQLG